MLTCLADTPETRSLWLSIWQRTGREPFAHPDYLRLFVGEHDKIQILYWNDQVSGTEIILPLICRPLPKRFRPLASNWTDAVSPYGYGGPFATPHTSIAWEDFWQDVLKWMLTERVLTIFVRTSLLSSLPSVVKLPEQSSFVPVHLNDNVIVDVRRPPQEQWGHYDHKVRKNVKKAERAGLTVEIRETYSSVPEFMDIYNSTMRRRSASDWYHFGLNFFEGFSEFLMRSHLVAEVRDATGKLISAELVLKSDEYLYSFLGGTHQDAFAFAPNDLLKHAVIDYGYINNMKGYILGGGFQRNDGIFRYKQSFDTEGVVPFYGIQLVADYSLLRRLEMAQNDYANEAGMGTQAEFFPAYRSPMIDKLEMPNSKQDVT